MKVSNNYPKSQGQIMHIQKIETKIGTFWIDTRDQFVAKSLTSTGEYSPGERALYSKFVTQNSNVLWLGAHIGALVIPFSKYVQRVDTFEANPETFEIDKFTTFHDVGINRLSIGVQSFHNQELERLGRIHNSEEAKLACYKARKIFNNINIDIMYGLPEQSVEINQSNVETALSYSPDHISYYQLTIEPNTYFHKYPPKLPSHESVFNYGIIGQKIIERSGLKRYEVSAYGQESRHNLNYWLFGDYIGIGAGAHGKITSSLENKVFRTFKNKSPKDYYKDQSSKLTNIENLTFDFMLNALRLKDGFEIDLFEKRTGIEFNSIEKNIQVAIDKGLLKINNTRVSPTPQGYDFLNDLQEIFL